MVSIQITFVIKFGNQQTDTNFSAPLFYNWSPTTKDQIGVKTSDVNATLLVWFENVSSSIPPSWSKHPIVSAQTLVGKLEVKNLDANISSIFEMNKKKYSPYEQFGKYVIKSIFYPAVSNFINTIRINYGQYWIRELQVWDSREIGLNNYCQMFEMKWSLDGYDWREFSPSPWVISGVTMKYRVGAEFFLEQFLLKRDLKTIEKFIDNGHKPTLAASLLARAHEYADEGHLRHSFIEGYTALELAVKEFTKSRVAGNKVLEELMGEFLNTALRSQIVAIGTTLGTIPYADLEKMLEAIKIRNEIVHEGKEPPSENESRSILQGLFKTISIIISGPDFKFPTISN